MFHGMEQNPTERTAATVRAEVARARAKTTDLARVLGLSRTTVWRRLTGEYPFNVAELDALASHLGVPVSTFFDDRQAA